MRAFIPGRWFLVAALLLGLSWFAGREGDAGPSLAAVALGLAAVLCLIVHLLRDVGGRRR